MFNYSEGQIIAIVKSSTKKDKILYIEEEPENEDIKYYDRISLKSDEYFQPIGNKTLSRPVCWALLGANGSGKSYQIGKFLSNYYIKTFPKHNIYLFSEKAEDVELDKFKSIKRIKLDDALLDDKITLEDLHTVSKTNDGVLCIFDDIDALDRALKKYMYSLVSKIFNVGRSYKINIIVTNHAITNGPETKAILNECNMITTFPKLGWNVQMARFWEKYVGLSKKEITMLRKNKGRPSTYYRTLPNVVVQQHDAFIIGSD